MPRTQAPRATTADLGFLLAKASAHWNELLVRAFAARGFGDVRPAYGSILLPLFEEDGQRIGDLGRRARLPKQTMTTLVRQMERDGLVAREADAEDGRAFRIHLTRRAREFRPVAEDVLGDLHARAAEHLTRAVAATLEQGLRDVLEL